MENWQAVGVVVEGDPITIGGLNPWAFKWHRVPHEPLELPHSTYPNQRHRMSVYEVESNGRTVRFAAGELSATVWGFYVPCG